MLADTGDVSWLRAHLTAVLVAVVAVAATGGVMTLALPHHAGSTEKVVDVSKGPQLSADRVLQVFAAHGIHLTRTSGHLPDAVSFTDVHPNGKIDDGFLVTVWSPTATVHVSTAGPKPRYERWVGNVDISDGALSYTLAARAAAAADALAR